MTDPQPPRGRFILPRNLLATLKKLQERAPHPSLSGDERDSFVIELALLGTEAQKIPGNFGSDGISVFPHGSRTIFTYRWVEIKKALCVLTLISP